MAPIALSEDGSETTSITELSTLIVTTVQASNIGSIKILRLNRPKAKNAISRALLRELSEQVDEIYTEIQAGQTKTRVLVIASALDDVFCAGADLKERKLMTQDETQEFLSTLRSTFARLSALPIPAIACVSGLALGGGLELALCCQLRVFSTNAVVGLPETRLAIIPGAGGTYRLAQLIGLARASDLILTGRRVEVTEAASLGLCNRISDKVEDALDAKGKLEVALANGIVLAQEIARGGPMGIRAAISALAGGSEAAENAAYELVLQTKDRIEALQAFGEKRAPIFVGE